MKTPAELNRILKDFLDEWPLERVKKLTLEGYVLGTPSFKESFCYWVETIAIDLGNIKGLSGGGSFKYGIYFKDPSKHYDSKLYMDDGLYAWARVFGETRVTAFEEIKRRIINVIVNSQNKDFESVDGIDKLFSLYKWKLAFLYSDYSLIPFYKHEWVIRIARELGYSDKSNRIPDLQNYIISQKPEDQDFFDWYNWLLRRFILNNESYFIIGSQYYDSEANKYNSVLDDFYKDGIISTGFLYNVSLQTHFSQNITEINEFLWSKGLPKNEAEALRQFLTIKKGDIIAIKDFGIPGKLKIVAYAIVVEDDNGRIYRHDPGGLGHCINVEFLERDVDLELPITKTHTLHRITDEVEINVIFGAYQQTETEEASSGKRKRKGTKKKHTSGHHRSGTSSVWIEEFHNQLQQQFFEWLKHDKNDPDGVQCLMEEDYVDISYRNNPKVELYEVKISPKPGKCIKEAVGQLMYYSSFEIEANGNLKLYVVGPGELKEDDKQLLNYVKSKLKIEIDYIHFPLNKS